MKRALLGAFLLLVAGPGPASPVVGQIVDKIAGVSYARLGGAWHPGLDIQGLTLPAALHRQQPKQRGIMDAQGAEYLAAPLPPGLGRTVSPDTATALAQRVVRVLSPDGHTAPNLPSGPRIRPLVGSGTRTMPVA